LKARGLGTAGEIFDGDPPFTPRGCIAQAWAVGEILRVWSLISSGARE
jgi:glycogen debranching enzyme